MAEERKWTTELHPTVDGVCPECYTHGYEDAEAELKATITRLEQDLMDYGVRFAALERERARAIDALQDLYDEQNGPPLVRDEASWQAAMRKSEAILREGQEQS